MKTNLDSVQIYPQLFHDKFPDVELVFDDGRIDCNLAYLVAISGTLRKCVMECHDVIRISGFKTDTFSNFINILNFKRGEKNISMDIVEFTQSMDIHWLKSQSDVVSCLQISASSSPKKIGKVIETENQGHLDSTKDVRVRRKLENGTALTVQSETIRAIGRPKGSKSREGEKVCRECGGSFDDSWKHKRQCPALNRDIKHICHLCRKGFRRLGAVKKHFQLSEKCKYNSSNQQEYAKLIKYADNEVKGRTVCHDCGCDYATRKGSQEHRKNCSAFTQFKCFACNRGINALDGFQIHFSRHPDCREAPANKTILAEMGVRAKKPEYHVCHLCGAQYRTRESIERHMVSHADNLEKFECKHPDCGKIFINTKARDLHLKNHLEPKGICSICGKQVKKGSMPLHMVLHTGKKVECTLCGKMFQHKGVLNKHMKSVHGDQKRKTENINTAKKFRKTPSIHRPTPVSSHQGHHLVVDNHILSTMYPSSSSKDIKD